MSTIKKDSGSAIYDYLLPRLTELLQGDSARAGAFARAAVSMATNDHEGANLMEFCTGIFKGAELGLQPGKAAGLFYLVPRKGKLCFEVSFKGLQTIVWNSLHVIVRGGVVYSGDEFYHENGIVPVLRHIPAEEGRGQRMYAYAICKMPEANGGAFFRVVDKVYIDKLPKAYSGGGPWKEYTDEMWMKTAVKYLINRDLPRDAILSRAMELENENLVDTAPAEKRPSILQI